MKLAEALILRADIQKRIEQLRSRLIQSALVQEGETPPEDPQELLTELDKLLNQLERLIVNINNTNIQTPFTEQEMLTGALASRDRLTIQYNAINDLANVASNRIDRHGHAEIRKVSTVDVAALRRSLDELARQRRELDTTIQAKNWSTDLIE
jgi:hypothetical protein